MILIFFKNEICQTRARNRLKWRTFTSDVADWNNWIRRKLSKNTITNVVPNFSLTRTGRFDTFGILFFFFFLQTFLFFCELQQCRVREKTRWFFLFDQIHKKERHDAVTVGSPRRSRNFTTQNCFAHSYLNTTTTMPNNELLLLLSLRLRSSVLFPFVWGILGTRPRTDR